MEKEVRKVDEYFENKHWNFNGNWVEEREKLAILQNVLDNKEIKWDDIPSLFQQDREFLMSIIQSKFEFYDELPAELAIEGYFIKGLYSVISNCDKMLKQEYENTLEDDIKLSMSLKKYMLERKIQMVSLFKRKIDKSKQELGLPADWKEERIK